MDVGGKGAMQRARRNVMDREMVEHYFSSLVPIKSMLHSGLITQDEYIIAEKYLANKFCIKKGSLYRENDLINIRKRVIYSGAKAVQHDLNKDI